VADRETRTASRGNGTSNPQHPTSNEQKPGKAAQSYILAKAEMLKAEMLKPERPHQCDIKATSKRVDRQPIATPKPP
jgi:hypothetical protein